MTAMDWKTLIQSLIDKGGTQAEIAAYCKCTQSAISDLARGVTTNPSFALGDALRKLAAEKAEA